MRKVGSGVYPLFVKRETSAPPPKTTLLTATQACRCSQGGSLSPRDAETAGSFPALGGFAYFHLQVISVPSPGRLTGTLHSFIQRGVFSLPLSCLSQDQGNAGSRVPSLPGLRARAHVCMWWGRPVWTPWLGRGQLCRLDTEGRTPFLGQGPGLEGPVEERSHRRARSQCSRVHAKAAPVLRVPPSGPQWCCPSPL